MKDMKDIKVIQHNAVGFKESDDLSYSWRLDASFRPPRYMSFAFICLIGGLEIIQVRGKTKEILEQFAKENHMYSHPRKQSLKIWQPEA